MSRFPAFAIIYVMVTISAAWAIAIQHHQAGRLQAAAQIYRQILAVEPNHAEALHLLGLINAQIGHHQRAVEYICHALTVKPNWAEAQSDLGKVLREQGKLDEAIACYRRALELKPDYAEAHNNLGNALKDQGNLDEAVACYRRVLELKPDYAEVQSNLGVALKEQGKLDEAIAAYRRVLELKPDFAEAHYNLGNALKGQGKLDEAVACYRRVLALKPGYAEAHINLAVALKDQGKLDEAIASYGRVLELKPDYAEVHNNLGIALRDRGKWDEAIAAYRRALTLKPDFTDVHYNLGSALEEIGDLKGAEDCFRAALRHNSRFAISHYKLAKLLGGKLPQQDLAALRRLLEERELTGAQRLFLHFALAQVLDARGEYAEAAQHLERGNALQLCEWRKCGQEYDPKEHEFFVTRMIRLCTPDFFERVRGFGLDSELPVFVVGLPRSGTTLVEQILASHSQVFAAGETTLARDTMAALGGQDADLFEGLCELDRQTARRLASRHLERLRGLNPAALRIVDKTLDNYLLLGPLASLFPRAKLIHCRRDLRDVAVSCWMTHFREIRWTNDQQQVVSRFHEYQRMMEHWRKVLPVPLLEVDYEETVADLEGVARKLVAWCGLAWEPNCLEFHQTKRPVRTASAVQVRRPVFRTSVGRWQHYERALGSWFAQLERLVAGNSTGR
jgi:tetratricopeptide (TPR) repeat protein